jgi:hypothetical protein
MADSWSSKVAWKQLHCAYGDSRVVGELLQEVLAGEDVWGDLFGQVLHQETIYEATVAVAAWMVEALREGRLGERLIPLHNPSTGEQIMVRERALVFGLLSGMAESAHEAVSSRSTPQQYAAIAALVLEVLRPGIPQFEAGVEDPDDQISEASSTLLKALAGGCVAAIDGQYQRSLRAKLGIPLPPPAV